MVLMILVTDTSRMSFGSNKKCQKSIDYFCPWVAVPYSTLAYFKRKQDSYPFYCKQTYVERRLTMRNDSYNE